MMGSFDFWDQLGREWFGGTGCCSGGCGATPCVVCRRHLQSQCGKIAAPAVVCILCTLERRSFPFRPLCGEGLLDLWFDFCDGQGDKVLPVVAVLMKQ